MGKVSVLFSITLLIQNGLFTNNNKEETCSYKYTETIQKNGVNVVKFSAQPLSVHNDKRYPVNTTVTLNCTSSHQFINGSNEIVCLTNGVWFDGGHLPKCVATCPQLELTLPKEKIELGHFSYDFPEVIKSTGSPDGVRYWVNTTATWSCSKDRHVLSGRAEFVCQEDGDWTNTDGGVRQQLESIRCVPTCTGHPAPDLINRSILVNFHASTISRQDGSKKGGNDKVLYSVNTTVSFRCKEEHEEFVGINQSVCLANGTWSHYGNLKCVPTCNAIPLSDDATRRTEDAIPTFDGSPLNTPAGRYSIGTKVTFDCAGYNFYLNGSKVIECLPEGKWNDTPPNCDHVVTGTHKEGLGTREYALIGACSALAFIFLLGIVIFFITRQKRSHSELSNGTREERLDPFPIYETLDLVPPSTDTSGSGKIYENIIPVFVNKEPIYADVEFGTGESSKSIDELINNDDEPAYSNIHPAGTSIDHQSNGDASSSSNYAKIVHPKSKNGVEQIYAQVDKTEK